MLAPKRILVCGGRNYKDRAKISQELEHCRQWFDDDFVIIAGGANGVDWCAKSWAIDNGYPCIEMIAAWDFYGPGAGVIRNNWMLKYAMPDLVIAFPGGVGTADMVKRAKKANIPIHEVKA